MKDFLLGTVLTLTTLTAFATDNIKVDYDPPQKLDAKFKLFKTENNWNFLQLDTQTGRVWQVQFTVDNDSSRVRIPINTESLAKDGKPGRFTLYPTKNMYNFLLLDQENGKIWQIQYALDNNQMIKAITDTKGGDVKGETKSDPKSDSKSGKPDSGWNQ